jgi:8-oxo-dGTP pyrophosphatase MutT (NUDIX family)
LPPTPDAFSLSTIAARLAPSRVPAPGLVEGQRAAVAAILREGAEGAEVLLIRRAERAGDPWSGHMAFPGGRRDAADPDLHATAVRETREEVGIDLGANGTLLGRLPDLDAVARARRTGLVITPFVFALAGESALVFDPEEVAEALWVPLAPLARGEGAGTVAWEIEGTTLDLPCWRVDGRVVWGLTYRMLQTLFSAISGEPLPASAETLPVA